MRVGSEKDGTERPERESAKFTTSPWSEQLAHTFCGVTKRAEWRYGQLGDGVFTWCVLTVGWKLLQAKSRM